MRGSAVILDPIMRQDLCRKWGDYQHALRLMTSDGTPRSISPFQKGQEVWLPGLRANSETALLGRDWALAGKDVASASLAMLSFWLLLP